MRTWIALSIVMLTLSGCSREPPASPPPPPPEQVAAPQLPAPDESAPADLADPSFIGRVWMSTSRGSPRGSMLVFLPDKTLLMDSCFETYRLSQWGIVAEDRIRWIEDTIPIEAQVIVEGTNTLRLRIGGREEDQLYGSASVPYVCPDMPR